MNSWIVNAVSQPPVLALRSSTVAIIAGATGKVLYVGFANDEG